VLLAGLGLTSTLAGHFLLTAGRKAKARPPEAQVRNARPARLPAGGQAGWRGEARTTLQLTGRPDRSAVAMCLETALQEARQQQKPLALALFSVDHLDEISGAQGHGFADKVFRQVERLLREEARPTVIIGRYSGDAYAAVWPATSVSEALLLAERIRKRVAQHAISDGQRSVQASLSAGIAVTAAGDKHTAEDLIGQAEGALRAAQQSGHDCTKTSAETTPDLRAPLEADPDVAGVCRQITSVLLQAKDGLAENLLGIVRAVDARDPYSKNHTKNVVHCVVGVAEQLGLGPDEIAAIRRSAIVHDIGNIGVPAAILSKAEALTAEERQAVQQHVMIGVHILEQVRILGPEVHILRHHHERWDGQGYPDGLAGETIPLGARVLAVADTFDAITSDRAYRRAGDVADALQILSRESYRQFDANVVDAAIRWVRSACSLQGARDGGTPAAEASAAASA
jgi:diguanylate cyclase (GGDEF)-like protein